MDKDTGDCTDAWLRIRHSGLPLSVVLKLIAQFGGAEAVLRCSARKLQTVPAARDILQALKSCNKQAVQNDTRWLKTRGSRHIVNYLDPRYPALLRELTDPPLLLYVDGDVRLLESCQLSVVGSRNPTPTGRELAFRFAANLSRLGLTITSGLAIGIDASAHRGALSVHAPTIAVMATGLDRAYPYQHQRLAEQISEQGVLVSEMPIGTPPRKQAFPQRNRIISGLCVGTMVVEATVRSGSLITARLAGEQGREVYAVPGSILSPQSRGCHALLRDGARLVETEEDILTELTHLCRPPLEASQPSSLPTDFQSLISFMGYDPVTIDVLVRRSGLTTDKVCSMLSRMELQGVVKTVLGGHYIRVR